MLNIIRKIVSFKWMTKNFFIRMFLLDIIVVIKYGMYKMYITGDINWDFVKLLWGSACALIGALTVRKVMGK